MLQEVVFIGRAEAEALYGSEDWAVISINEPEASDGAAKPQSGWHAVHQVAFHDISAPVLNMPYVLMDVGQAQDIANFVRAVAPVAAGIIVHCRAGVSRSAAIARWISKTYGLPFPDDYAWDNRHVYELLRTAAEG
jgi:predicted protein tyrosine phosphatase